MSWQLFKTIVFFDIPGRLAPFIVLAMSIAWSLSISTGDQLLLAFAASAGVALIIRIIGVDGPEPWELPDFHLPTFRKHYNAWPPGTGGPPRKPPTKKDTNTVRIPDLP